MEVKATTRLKEVIKMCIDVEPNLYVTEKAKNNLATMFEFFDMVQIRTAKSYYILVDEPKFNIPKKFFCGKTLNDDDVIIPLSEIKNCKMKGWHRYDEQGVRVDLELPQA